MTDLPAIAVIADAHLHDIDSDFNGASTCIEGTNLTLRSWKDTRKSSRVFNESCDALKTALNDIQQRGIHHVVLLGDYTDDGQIESSNRVASLLRQYRLKYDMEFYATPGNHDVYGPAGKHQSTRFVKTPDKTVLVTSNPKIAETEADTSILTRKMYCEGSPAGLMPFADCGYFRQSRYIHWETPFGQSDTPASRMYEARSSDGSAVHSLMDASYLVEPYNGIWLLMIDANVFEPRNGQTSPLKKNTFLNSSDAGWNSVLRIKPFLLDWIRDVNTRANLLGKQLYAFSHYPTLDHFNRYKTNDVRLFGHNEDAKRTPDATVAESLLAAGLTTHFSGHLHINNETHYETDAHTLSDIAVPSLAAFPACYKCIYPSLQNSFIETIAIGEMPINPKLIAYYQSENKAIGNKDESALNATSYGEFLYLRMRTRVRHHYLPKEWPEGIACQIEYTTTVDLVYFMLAQKLKSQPPAFGLIKEPLASELKTEFSRLIAKYDLTVQDFVSCSMLTLIADWYCMRQASEMATAYISSGNRKIYVFLGDTLSEPDPAALEPHAAFFNVFIKALHLLLKEEIDNSSLL